MQLPTVPLLDHGSVTLVDSMGGDLNIVNAARTSFNNKAILHSAGCPESNRQSGGDALGECQCGGLPPSEGKGHLLPRDAGLIKFLMRERHGTPFEMVDLMFEFEMPIFVMREQVRHRISSFNEMSGRYVELPRKWYVPARDQIREQKGKPGAYYYERMEDDAKAEEVRRVIDETSTAAFDMYEDMLRAGVAKEVARVVLPLNTYTKAVWKVNLRALMNYLGLRNHEHAQWEIQQYAKAMEEMAFKVAPVAMQAFVDNGRVAP